MNSTLDEGQTPILQPVGVPEVMCTLRASGAGFSSVGNAVTEHETYIPMINPDVHGVAQQIHYRKSRRAQSVDDHETWVEDDVTNTLNTFDLGDVRAVDVVAQPIGFDAYNNSVTGDVSKTLDTGQDYHHVPNVMQTMAVRRLTPVECERLQGFPDGYTDIRPNGKNTPDGPRYKALGNSMAVPVMRWIGNRIRNLYE